jgi:hypothetical protein
VAPADTVEHEDGEPSGDGLLDEGDHLFAAPAAPCRRGSPSPGLPHAHDFRYASRVKALLRIGLAIVIVASAYSAIVRVAEEKADALAGGGAFPLDRQSPEEWDAFAALLDQLRRWEEPGLAVALGRLQESGALWVAPRLTGQRSAISVQSLGLVSRVFVRRDELVNPGLPFPDLEVPEPAQRTFATIRLAGTLLHELQHHEGLEDEAETYDREIAWYRHLREGRLERPEGEDRHWFEWAVDSAIQSAEAAREKAAVGL